jgi:predicted nuclease of restriction endonuclease-like (RecB) superfamily
MLQNDQEYKELLLRIKQQIQASQTKAIIAVNNELIQLYWKVGHEILARQQKEGWGTKVVERLSKDLKKSFPDLKGFSQRNLLYMRKFAEDYPDFKIVQQAVAQISWSHNIILLTKCAELEKRLWYAQKSIQNGWSRNTLQIFIESDLYGREGSNTNNFNTVLAMPNSDLVEQTLKDPYIFDFLNLTEQVNEKGIEDALVENITDFLLELGKGFAYVGRQYHVPVGGVDFYLDLLFYHIDLECYVVVELKAKEFKPEYVGKLGFYLTAVNEQIKKPQHNPTIGILICREKNEIIAKYALGETNHPIGVSEFKLSKDFEKKIKKTLPLIEDLEKGLNDLGEE